MNLKERTQQVYNESVDYLNEMPIDIFKLFTSEDLYDLCYEYSINQQIAEAENKAEELKLEKLYEQD